MSDNSKPTVLVDTSFLITLYDDTRTNHDVALKYFKYFLRNGIVMYLSVIVISEFHQMQAITDIINSGNYIPLAFNYEDSLETSDIAFKLGKVDRRGDSKAEYKDDIKLIGQAKSRKIDYIITDDCSTLSKYCEKLNGAKMLDCKAIALNNGFDVSIFNGGQVALLVEEV